MHTLDESFFIDSSGDKNCLSIIHQNIRSMRKNFDEFVIEISSWKTYPDIIIFTEIWISSLESQFYLLSDYELVLNSNENYRSGGVALYYKKDMFTNFEFQTIKFVSADALEIKFSIPGVNFAILALYRLHDYSIPKFVSELGDYFIALENNVDFKNFAVIGDLNIDLLKTNIQEVDSYKILMASYGLESLINETTRKTDRTESCIDHVFARVQDKNRLSIDATVIRRQVTDHYLTAVRLGCGGVRGGGDSGLTSQPAVARTRIDYEQLNGLLGDTDWSHVYSQQDASVAYDLFEATLLQCIGRCKKDVILQSKLKKLKPWVNYNICRRVEKRNKLYKQVKNKPINDPFRNYYIHYRNTLKKDIEVAKLQYYQHKFEKSKGNVKATWKTINEITAQNKRPQSYSLDVNNVVINDSQLVANEFNKYFLSVVDEVLDEQYVYDNLNSTHSSNIFNLRYEVCSFMIGPIFREDVLKSVNSLKCGKAPGIDGIDSLTIKQILPNILDVFTFIVNISFSSGVFPKKLKSAVVIPIHKKYSTLLCSNFRPISLISTFAKVIEKVMKEKLLSFLKKTNFFSNNQFGFRLGLNTETALLRFVNQVTDSINNKKQVLGLFLDIKKAFDTVNHAILLDKLYNIGIRGVAHNWFKSYLAERQQCVKINDVFSSVGVIKHGVPQGSVLGAVLFIIYINDLCSAKFKGAVTTFADDTALFYEGDAMDLVRKDMNSDLESIKWWFTKNKLVLSTEKSNFIKFSLKRDDFANFKLNYKCTRCLDLDIVCPKCAEIGETDTIKYLGVTLDKEMNWKYHVCNLKSKLVWGIRLFYFMRKVCPIQVMRSLYFALVHSKLEYGIVCYGGTYKTTLVPLKKIQKHYIRIILNKNCREPSYPCFKKMKILPLRNLYVFKILKAFYLKSGTTVDTGNTFREKLRSAENYKVPKPNTSFYTKSFNFLGPRIFNKLPLEFKQLKNAKAFLKKVKIWSLNYENIDTILNVVQ